VDVKDKAIEREKLWRMVPRAPDCKSCCFGGALTHLTEALALFGGIAHYILTPKAHNSLIITHIFPQYYCRLAEEEVADELWRKQGRS